MSTAPAIHVRDGRIHFKFGDTKSVFYLTETDLDISPPDHARRWLEVVCSGKPARTDRSAQGLGLVCPEWPLVRRAGARRHGPAAGPHRAGRNDGPAERAGRQHPRHHHVAPASGRTDRQYRHPRTADGGRRPSLGPAAAARAGMAAGCQRTAGSDRRSNWSCSPGRRAMRRRRSRRISGSAIIFRGRIGPWR